MYVHTANVIKSAGVTFGAGKNNSIPPKGEFGTILGGENIKSRLPAPQFVPVRKVKPQETSHQLEVVITTKLKVNIQ